MLPFIAGSFFGVFWVFPFQVFISQVFPFQGLHFLGLGNKDLGQNFGKLKTMLFLTLLQCLVVVINSFKQSSFSRHPKKTSHVQCIALLYILKQIHQRKQKCLYVTFLVEEEDERQTFGGEGIFQSYMNFSRYYFLWIEFQEYFLGLLGMSIFFHKIFPCTNIILKCTSPAPPHPLQ